MEKSSIEIFWESLEPFNGDINKIPELPVTTKERWDNFFVPILIKCGAIPKDKLETGATYLGSCRNSETAIWNGFKFVYNRNKFGISYEDEINHFQHDDGYDLFVPIKKL